MPKDTACWHHMWLFLSFTSKLELGFFPSYYENKDINLNKCRVQ